MSRHEDGLSSPSHFSLHAVSVHPVHTQGETHHRHHYGNGRHKVAQRGRGGSLDSDDVSCRIVADASIQHAQTAEVTLTQRERQV